jgi:hypothetical protein
MAFMTVINANEVLGEGFRSLKRKIDSINQKRRHSASPLHDSQFSVTPHFLAHHAHTR